MNPVEELVLRIGEYAGRPRVGLLLPLVDRMRLPRYCGPSPSSHEESI